jgi:small subunit ribosomal protein S18
MAKPKQKSRSKFKTRRSRTLVKTLRLDLKSLVFSYKEPDLLARFVTEYGSILSRTDTGLTSKLQRQLAREVKRARHLALLPFTQTLG